MTTGANAQSYGSDRAIEPGKCYTVSLYILARPEGFEPPTSGFEVLRSILLSYGRAEFIIIAQEC